MVTQAEIRVMHLWARENQRWPASTGSWKRQGRILPQRLQREQGPADTVILDFWPPKL